MTHHNVRYETPGEDALVSGRFAVQFVTGLQGDPDGADSNSKSSYLQHAATCKHSLLYDVETGRATTSSHAQPRDLTEYFLVPFEFCIKRASVASIMCQYGADDGTPSCANSAVNNDLYRNTYVTPPLHLVGSFESVASWVLMHPMYVDVCNIDDASYLFRYGFDGFMVSDCDSVAKFPSFPKINASTPAEDTAAALRGGLDVDCGTTYASIAAVVKEGLVSEKLVRQAARRFIAKQIALGALEHTPWDAVPASVVDTPEHRALALEAAKQSIVLLRNEPASATVTSNLLPERAGIKEVAGTAAAGTAAATAADGGNGVQRKGVLPLTRTSKLAFIGLHADSTVEMLGNYHGVNLQVLNRTIKDVAKQQGIHFEHADGTDVAAAVAIAQAAEAAVLFLGYVIRCSRQ